MDGQHLTQITILWHLIGKGIIIPIDLHFVVYPGSASVDEGAGVDKGVVF